MTRDLSEEELTEKIKNLNYEDTSKEPALTKKKSLPSIFNSNIERFRFLCKDFPSPDIFIDFNFYFLISACLARKVWLGNSSFASNIFPNLYLVFVSDPGIGKSLPANVCNNLLNSLKETKYNKNTLEEYSLLNLGPDAITYEKLIIRASMATDNIRDKKGKIYTHSSTTFCLVEELNLLFSDNTKKVVAFLLQCYNCGEFKADTIKHKEQNIKNVCINFLGNTTPEIMKDLMRTKVLDSGFIGRTLFIFGEKKRPHPPLIETSEQQVAEFEHLKKHLRNLCKIKPGPVEFTEEARRWMEHWHHNKQDIHLNNHPRLKDYYARRKTHLVKLAINHAYADNVDPTVDVKNFVAAEKLLAWTEPLMHRALAIHTENPLALIAEKIKEYLKQNGPSTRRKLMLSFFDIGDEIQLGRVFQYLIDTGQCDQVTINNREGLKVNEK